MERFLSWKDQMIPSPEEDQSEAWQNILYLHDFRAQNGHQSDDWHDMSGLQRDPDFDENDDEFDDEEDLDDDRTYYDHVIENGMDTGAYYDHFGNEVNKDHWKDQIPREDDWFDDFTQESGCPHPLLDMNENETIALMKRYKTIPLKEDQNTTQTATASVNWDPANAQEPKVGLQTGTKTIQERGQTQINSEKDVHPIEYIKVIQNSNQIAIRSLGNLISAIRTFKNHSLLCDECRASKDHHSVIIEQEVKMLRKELESLLNTIKES